MSLGENILFRIIIFFAIALILGLIRWLFAKITGGVSKAVSKARKQPAAQVKVQPQSAAQDQVLGEVPTARTKAQQSFDLVGRGGAMNECRFPLAADTLCIGTDPDSCAIVYPPASEGIAPIHCQLMRTSDGWSLVDFSSGETYLNGEKLTEGEPVAVKLGDVFWLSRMENSFVLEARA